MFIYCAETVFLVENESEKGRSQEHHKSSNPKLNRLRGEFQVGMFKEALGMSPWMVDF